MSLCVKHSDHGNNFYFHIFDNCKYHYSNFSCPKYTQVTSLFIYHLYKRYYRSNPHSSLNHYEILFKKFNDDYYYCNCCYLLKSLIRDYLPSDLYYALEEKLAQISINLFKDRYTNSNFKYLLYLDYLLSNVYYYRYIYKF